MFNYVFSFFSSLNKNSHPGDIAHGVALGLLLAIMPKDNLLWPILFVFSLFIRSNKGAFFLSLILLGFLTPFLDVVIERLGFFLLSLEFLQSFYIMLDKIPFVGLTKFYNTMVAGGLLLGLILYIPTYAISRFLVYQYRKHFQSKMAKFTESKFSAIVGKLPFLKHLSKVEDIKDFLNK